MIDRWWQTSDSKPSVDQTPEKRIKDETTGLSSPKPLTEANLALLEGKISGAKKRKTDTALQTEPGMTEGAEAPNLSNDPKHTSNSTKIGDMLTMRNLLHGDRASEKSLTVTQAGDLVRAKRHSPMQDDELEKFKETRMRFMKRSEADYVTNVWSILILPDRTKYVPPKEEEPEKLLKRAFIDDHLDVTIDQLFLQTSLPKMNAKDDAVLQELLKKLPRIAIPKPDRSYGLSEDAFMLEEQRLNDLYTGLTKVAQSIYHTFFVVEFKSYKHPIAEAELQARRSGAALMHCLRQFKNLAGILDDASPPDAGSFVYSLAMIPDLAKLYVHWTELKPDRGLVYHMHWIQSYAMDKPSDAMELRHDVNNILEWGCEIRKNYIMGCLAKIKATQPWNLPEPSQAASVSGVQSANEVGVQGSKDGE